MTMKNVGGSLAFNGQNNSDLAPKGSSKYSGNQSGKTMPSNVGRGPTKAGYTGEQAGPATATGRDQKRGQGGVEAKCPANADRINYGKQMTRGNS